MKRFIAVLCVLLVLMTSFAFGEEKVRLGALKGPTGMAFAHLMEKENDYDLTLVAAPEEMTGLIINGSVDIAAVPINLGAVLYNKTQGGVKALSLITRGMLYILEKGDTVHSVADLQGKTIASAGQGATPEYVTDFILKAAGVEANVEYYSEHAEVSTRAASGMADLVLLPEPHVTSLLMKDDSFRVALDLTKEFEKAAQSQGMENAQLSMSMVIVRSVFYEEHPEQVVAFLDDLATSIAFANENVEAASEEIVALGILPSTAVAEKALPSCQLVCIVGEDMQAQAEALYEILFQANPGSVGRALPDEAFYVK